MSYEAQAEHIRRLIDELRFGDAVVHLHRLERSFGDELEYAVLETEHRDWPDRARLGVWKSAHPSFLTSLLMADPGAGSTCDEVSKTLMIFGIFFYHLRLEADAIRLLERLMMIEAETQRLSYRVNGPGPTSEWGRFLESCYERIGDRKSALRVKRLLTGLESDVRRTG